MKFVGTTVIYAYFQAVGVLCSHEQGCFLAFQKAEHHNSYFYDFYFLIFIYPA